MGTFHGIPLAAADDRIAAAVFGLNALRPGDDEMAANAADITIPILFLNQSDDELMTRDAALALWDAFGSAEKTMHINRSEEHTSELQSLKRNSYAVYCLKKKYNTQIYFNYTTINTRH